MLAGCQFISTHRLAAARVTAWLHRCDSAYNALHVINKAHGRSLRSKGYCRCARLRRQARQCWKNVEIQSPNLWPRMMSRSTQSRLLQQPGIGAVIITPAVHLYRNAGECTATSRSWHSIRLPRMKAYFIGTGSEDAALNGRAVAEACKALRQDKPTAVIIARRTGRRTAEARLPLLPRYDPSRRRSGARSRAPTPCRTELAKRYGRLSRSTGSVDAVLSIADDMAPAAKVIKVPATQLPDTVLACGFWPSASLHQEAFMDGSLTIDIAQMGYDMGYKAVEAAVTVLEGGSVESFIDSRLKLSTPPSSTVRLETAKSRACGSNSNTFDNVNSL